MAELGVQSQPKKGRDRGGPSGVKSPRITENRIFSN
jgi:hypothetical protein